MRMKVVAALAFLLNTALFATYYAVSKEAMGRIDPIVFNFFVMAALVPLGLTFLLFARHELSRAVIKSGAIMGTCLCLGLCTLGVALKYNSATSTAFFPSLNGLLAALCAWLFARQPVTKATWFAGLISVGGALLLIFNSELGGPRGALIAFIGGLICTFYVFVADHEQRGKNAPWALFGVQLLTMAIWASMIALLFGDWQGVKAEMPHDLWVVLYISLGTTCLPTLITVWLQKHIAPLTVSFIYILEPVLGALFAFFYLRESIPLEGYIGGVLIVAGAVMHTWRTAERPATRRQALHDQFSEVQTRIQRSWFATLVYPLVCCLAGGFLLVKLGGVPPRAWSELIQMLPQLSSLLQQGRWLSSALLVAQALCWLLAWGALSGMAILALVRTVRKLTSYKEEEDYEEISLVVREERIPEPLQDAEIDAHLLHVFSNVRYRAPKRRSSEPEHVQRRRVERKKRLATAGGYAPLEREDSLISALPVAAVAPMIASGQAYDDLEVVDMGDRDTIFERYEHPNDIVRY